MQDARTPMDRYAVWASLESGTRFLGVMRDLLDGLSVEEVAQAWNMDRATAEVHRKALYGELSNLAVYGGKILQADDTRMSLKMQRLREQLASEGVKDVVSLRKAGYLIWEIMDLTGKSRHEVLSECEKYRKGHPGYRFPIEIEQGSKR